MVRSFLRQARAWMLRLDSCFRAQKLNADSVAELESHIDMQVEDGIRAGRSPAGPAHGISRMSRGWR